MRMALAILRFDYHSLTRQQSGVMINLVKQHATMALAHAPAA